MPHEVQTGSEGPDLGSTSAVVFSLSSFSQPRAGRPEAREAAQGEHCCRRAALVWTFAARLHFVQHVYNSIQPAAAVVRVSRRRADALSWSAAVSHAPAGRPEAGEASQREHCCRRAAQVWTFAARLHFVRHAYNSIQPAAAVARVSRRRADALSWSASRLLVRLASTRIRASSARARARRRPRVAKFCCRRDED